MNKKFLKFSLKKLTALIVSPLIGPKIGAASACWCSAHNGISGPGSCWSPRCPAREDTVRSAPTPWVYPYSATACSASSFRQLFRWVGCDRSAYIISAKINNCWHAILCMPCHLRAICSNFVQNSRLKKRVVSIKKTKKSYLQS